VRVWREKSGQEGFPPPRVDRRLLVSPGTFVVGDEMRSNYCDLFFLFLFFLNQVRLFY